MGLCTGPLLKSGLVGKTRLIPMPVFFRIYRALKFKFLGPGNLTESRYQKIFTFKNRLLNVENRSNSMYEIV